jgi:dethiobiotin synthetase
MAQRLGLPVMLVVGVRLGCLNHASLTLESIGRSGLPLAGWVGSLIDPGMSKMDENIAALSDMAGRPALCMLPWKPSAGTLAMQVDAAVEALQTRK